MADLKASDPVEDTSSQVNLAILSSLERLNEGMAKLTDYMYQGREAEENEDGESLGAGESASVVNVQQDLDKIVKPIDNTEDSREVARLMLVTAAGVSLALLTNPSSPMGFGPRNRNPFISINRCPDGSRRSWNGQILVFKPHSTRHAASTAAFQASIPLDDILRKAGWSSAKTFRRFYFRHVIDETVEC
ncbi:uncharacterized protein [Montipora capricornis]|uniref:uncharacterized protein n=1 Tax=Montipora capricornis TaxID=246305 RepID=UPI0035F182A7